MGRTIQRIKKWKGVKYKVITTKKFEKDIKMYRKKFRHVQDDIKEIVDNLKLGNLIGDIIPNVKMIDDSNNVIKVRVANSDVHVGKSNGYRMYIINSNIIIQNVF